MIWNKIPNNANLESGRKHIYQEKAENMNN